MADFLISHRGTGILIEQKCKEDPTSRTPQKVELWAWKKARERWSQVRRAFTRPRDAPIWCDHPRLGRKELRGGLPPIRHGVVALEVFQPVDLGPDGKGLPLDHDGVPISYLSLNDFLNLAVQLRSIPELIDYLSARRVLPDADLRRIGDEETLLNYYLLNDGSFLEADRYASLLEHVADELAHRNPRYA